MNLKTLKELDFDSITRNELIAEKDISEQIRYYLRNEAVKWVKSIRIEEPYIQNEAVILWIMNFFNLTEEDLK